MAFTFKFLCLGESPGSPVVRRHTLTAGHTGLDRHGSVKKKKEEVSVPSSVLLPIYSSNVDNS